MMKIIINYILILYIALQSFNSYSLSNNYFIDKRNCFIEFTADFKTWRQFIQNKNDHGNDSDKRINRVMNWFDSRFNIVDFNHYQSALECINFKYNVGEEVVDGFMIKPRNITMDLPVLIYNRGGNGNFSAVNFASLMLNIFPIADQGFIIIGSQYRGVGKKEKDLDEFGGKDVDDVLKLFDLITHINGADEDNIGMFGASRGAMQTFLSLRNTNKLKAVATIAGVSDLFKGLENRPEMERVYSSLIPSYTKNKEIELRKRSSIYWINELPKNVPILLLHGESDKKVSVEQSITFAKKLTEKGYKNKLIVYPHDDHFLNNNREASRLEIVNWFNLYLK